MLSPWPRSSRSRGLPCGARTRRTCEPPLLAAARQHAAFRPRLGPWRERSSSPPPPRPSPPSLVPAPPFESARQWPHASGARRRTRPHCLRWLPQRRLPLLLLLRRWRRHPRDPPRERSRFRREWLAHSHSARHASAAPAAHALPLPPPAPRSEPFARARRVSWRAPTLAKQRRHRCRSAAPSGARRTPRRMHRPADRWRSSAMP